MESVLVTGGAGYIGSIMVPKLLSAGYKVTVLDNFRHQTNSLAHCCASQNFEIFKGDARDESLVKDCLKKCDIVIPLAALVGAPLCKREPELARQTNHDAIANMLQFMSSEQMLLMPTTNSGYGVAIDDEYCTEESPLNPISEYGKDKVEIEKKILDRENSVSFRLATVFGMSPRMRVDLLVNDFVYRGINDGYLVLFESHFRRNYIHISDVVEAFLHGIRKFDIMKGNAFNVGLSDANLTKLELAELVQKFIPHLTIITAEVGEDPDKRDYLVSNEKIEKTGFKPQISLADGIAELKKGYVYLNNLRYGNYG